jgi:prolyl-tRNA editing enzyme YbaK/EbsC (Cys-tRNA(Pro) deacylase)
MRGVTPRQIVKSMVVKDGTGEYHVVLVPGDRVISWPKLRGVLGVNKAAMPSAEEAKAVTGFARGTITPFGTATPLDVVADALVEPGPITVGGGAHSVAIYLDGDDLLAHFGATRVDITDPDPAFAE